MNFFSTKSLVVFPRSKWICMGLRGTKKKLVKFTFTINSKILNLESLTDPSIDEFKKLLCEDGDDISQPKELKLSCIQGWPAIKHSTRSWKKMELLRTRIGDSLVPIEIGENYMDPNIEKTVVPFKLFLDYVKQSEKQKLSAQEIAYLAQHRLFEDIPELAKDIETPYLCNSGRGDSYGTNAWFGPKGTISPMHTDPYHNIFVQVVGSKYLRLYSPAYSSCIPISNNPLQKNTSSADLEDPELAEKYPELAGLPYYEKILEPGEALFIPKRWWHYCRSESVSFSVNFWWL